MPSSTPNTLGTAIITGASSGLGKVYADRLAARHYNLLLIARRGDRLQAIKEDLEERFNIQVEPLVADLADPADLAKTVQTITNRKDITFLVNNAGTSLVSPLEQTSQKALDSMVALNITALSALTAAVLPHFQERDAGTIINIGSVVGYAGFPWVPVYGATKAYVLNLTQALQKQLASTNIRVQLVTPAATVSEIWDICGVPLANLDPATVMTTEHCVDAALRGLDLGEAITVPSLQDIALLHDFQKASEALMQTPQASGQPAQRYGLHH